MTTITHLIPPAILLGLLVSVVFPALSAAIVKLHWDSSITGIITALLSTATGFAAEWAHALSNDAPFDWRTVGLAALGSWLVASLAQARVLSGTGLEGWLLALRSNTDDPASQGEPDPTVGLDANEVETFEPSTVRVDVPAAVPSAPAVSVSPAVPAPAATPAPTAQPAPVEHTAEHAASESA